MAHTNDFDIWYRSEHPRVLAAVLVVCGSDKATAEDATSDAFVKALERWKTVSTMDSPTGWIIQVATNNARRRLRRRSRRSELEEAAHTERYESAADPHIWEALKQLSPQQRAALVLRYAEDFTQAQVAETLGVAPGTAAATLNHGRSRLRKILTGDPK